MSTASTSFLRTPDGRLAYTDVGDGPPILFLHGNPTSAFLYRHLIDALRTTHRCVAPDYLGFGRSDAPDAFSYRPPDHAAHVEALIRRLDLDRPPDGLTLVMHDWGGPIGLAFALRHPASIRRLVLFNTWGWPHDRDPWIGAFSRLAGGSLGRLLIERGNAFARWIVPLAFADRSRLSDAALRTYVDALDTTTRRRASWVFPRALLGETAWLRSLWAHRRRLRDVPATIIWGTRDPAFGAARYLRRWTTLFRAATVHRIPVGHYVPEELGPDAVPLLTDALTP